MAAKTGIPALFMSKKNGVHIGTYKAKWKEGGRQVVFTTGTKDRSEALARAIAEQARTKATFSPPPPATPRPSIFGPPENAVPAPSIFPAPTLSPSPPGTAITPPSPGAPFDLAGALSASLNATSAQAQAPGALAVIPGGPTTEEVEKVRRLHKVAAKILVMIEVGALKRAVRFAGREPGDSDPDEEALMAEGWEEIAARYFGTSTLSPWGKIALGSAVAGGAMYLQGKPLPRKQLPAISDDNGTDDDHGDE